MGRGSRIVPLDRERLNAISAELAEWLFRDYPWMEEHARMELPPQADESQGWWLLVELRAPHNPELELVVWVECGDEPSLGFGAWHTHGDLQEYLPGILEGRLVEGVDLQGDLPQPGVALVDLARPDDLLDELTMKSASGRYRIRSWSGTMDCVLELIDPSLEERLRAMARGLGAQS
ncbi:MAG: hypothetical protein CMJ94_03875 [Planctomycetes bacterium]|nr:hypothetical protein [Planctomycetota bacterium]